MSAASFSLLPHRSVIALPGPDRAEFLQELSGSLEQLVLRYHDPAATGGRRHRLVLAVHPSITKPGAPALADAPVRKETS